jgi:hypothetical protein
MNIVNVQDAIATQLDTITGLRVSAYPPDRITPPTAIVAWPDSYIYDETFVRGMDRLSLPVVVLVSKVSDRASRAELAAYCNGSGASSIKAVLESGSYSAFDTLRVQSVDFDVVSIAGTEYMAANFTVDVVGTGV